MLYLVISTPHFSKPEDVKIARPEFKSWIEDLKSKNKVISTYHKMGKGSVVIFDVSSNDELHSVLTQWLDIVPVPVSYEIHPLVTPSKGE